MKDTTKLKCVVCKFEDTLFTDDINWIAIDDYDNPGIIVNNWVCPHCVKIIKLWIFPKEKLSFGEKIKYARKLSQLTCKEVGSYLDMSEANVSYIEANKRTISKENIEKLIVLFGFNFDIKKK